MTDTDTNTGDPATAVAPAGAATPAEGGARNLTHREMIEAVVNDIRPMLMQDGGDCELVDVSEDGKTVYVRLQGHCTHCPSAIYTLKYGIEQVLREMVPGVETVEAVP